MGRRLSEVLETGDFIYVVATQRFTSSMMTSLDYLNTTMRHGRFYLVEIVRLQGLDLVAHSAQVVASPHPSSRPSGSGGPGQANEADFLKAIESDAYREAMKDIFSTCATLGLTLFWGAKGASIRIQTPDRTEANPCRSVGPSLVATNGTAPSTSRSGLTKPPSRKRPAYETPYCASWSTSRQSRRETLNYQT